MQMYVSMPYEYKTVSPYAAQKRLVSLSMETIRAKTNQTATARCKGGGDGATLTLAPPRDI